MTLYDVKDIQSKSPHSISNIIHPINPAKHKKKKGNHSIHEAIRPTFRLIIVKKKSSPSRPRANTMARKKELKNKKIINKKKKK
jgi:hypothetical protein